ncbi:helix-turn-helix domain-containing protein [Christensenella sp. MSJ-20]|uniref:helix-turn-helix domain-containing protein n=1 Tax=Christensenella sp. MSJ-20 TaxID=2841518 RepID=UPI001C744246|nr:helix-turn-helix domain-containing protein [Christensenella sp. MSJ-20]
MSRSMKISNKNRSRYIELGLNVAYYRKLTGITQEALAERCGLSRTYISNIEASNMITTVSLEALFNIADALEIEPYKLLEFRT